MKLFEKNGHAIIWGDAIEALTAEIPDASVDLAFAAPPYNIGKNFNGRKDRWPSEEAYLAWCYQWLELCVSKLKPTGSLYAMMATQNMPSFDLFLRQRLSILSRIVWAYDSSGVQARNYFGSLYEPILFCVKDKDNYTFNADDILVEACTGVTRKLIDYRKTVPTMYSSKKVPGNVWNIPRVRYRMGEYENHPTHKPTALLDRIIRASSNPGDLVLDPFSGTFTTSYVAQALGRDSIGIEAEEEDVKIGLRRLAIVETYNGEVLRRESKIYEQRESPAQHHLAIFEKHSQWNTTSRRRSSARLKSSSTTRKTQKKNETAQQLADLARFLAKAEEAHPPWRLAKFNATALEQSHASALISVVLEALEKTRRPDK